MGDRFMCLGPHVQPYLGRSGPEVSSISILGCRAGAKPAGQQLGQPPPQQPSPGDLATVLPWGWG